MKFFSKLVFICNCCFVIAVILRWIENAHKKNGNFNGAIQINSLESMLVILGYGAIFVNFIVNILLVLLFTLKVQQVVPKWLAWVNVSFFFLQIYYFLFSNF